MNMALFKWDDRYLTGIMDVDEQHKRLVWLINDLHDAMREGRGKEALSTILCKLMDYSVYHFRMEEDLMKEHGYPETDEHVKLHADFIIKVQDISRRHEKGEYMISLETNEFLKEWLSGHILGTDKKMGPFILDIMRK